VDEVRVESWLELNERVFDNSWQGGLERFRTSFVFRGVANARADLATSLMRLGDSCERLELPLLRAFRRYAHRQAAVGDSWWNWLALAQHHGLPTRLLDWTYSPYVAMHFATADVDAFGMDGAIWAIDFQRSNELLPDKLKNLLHEEGANVFTAEMLHRAAGNFTDLEGLSAEDFVIFMEPPSLDDRIVNQFALFALMSRVSVRLDDWLAARPELGRRYIIPAELKWEVRDKLDQANITERVLFPGLDGLSSWLKRYYTPKQTAVKRAQQGSV
jgi:hypothetical protein